MFQCQAIEPAEFGVEGDEVCERAVVEEDQRAFLVCLPVRLVMVLIQLLHGPVKAFNPRCLRIAMLIKRFYGKF